MSLKQIQIKQIKSIIGTTELQQKNMLGLGLKKIGMTVVREDTPSVRGMIRKVIHLIEISRPSTTATQTKKTKPDYELTGVVNAPKAATKKTPAKTAEPKKTTAKKTK